MMGREAQDRAPSQSPACMGTLTWGTPGSTEMRKFLRLPRSESFFLSCNQSKSPDTLLLGIIYHTSSPWKFAQETLDIFM